VRVSDMGQKRAGRENQGENNSDRNLNGKRIFPKLFVRELFREDRVIGEDKCISLLQNNELGTPCDMIRDQHRKEAVWFRGSFQRDLEMGQSIGRARLLQETQIFATCMPSPLFSPF
jgi:hypothetical protein